MTATLTGWTRDDALARLHDMLRIRRMEERCAQLYGEQKIRGFLHLAIGEEAVAAGVFAHLQPQDKVVATYREHGHALLRGVSMKAIMAEMYGKQEGCSRGRGGSMHLFDVQAGFFGGNAIVGGGLPLAVGLALADRLAGRPGGTLRAAIASGMAPLGQVTPQRLVLRDHHRPVEHLEGTLARGRAHAAAQRCVLDQPARQPDALIEPHQMR